MTMGTTERLTRAATDGSYAGEELRDMLAAAAEVADYIERATGRRIDGAIRSGIDHIMRERMLPFLTRRPKDLLRALGENIANQGGVDERAIRFHQGTTGLWFVERTDTDSPSLFVCHRSLDALLSDLPNIIRMMLGRART